MPCFFLHPLLPFFSLTIPARRLTICFAGVIPMNDITTNRFSDDFRPYDKYEPLFGAWHFKRFIGAGGSGRVYEIERREWNKTYRSALKVITIPQDKGELQRLKASGNSRQDIADYYRTVMGTFAEEYAIMADFKGNSSIVSYEDHQIIPHEDGIGYDILIRMELLTPLMDYLMKNPLSEMDVIRLGSSLCEALTLCHSRDILHRDVKPDNIFVSESGFFKLGDFGIARIASETFNFISKKGTYAYMAPEVYRGESYGKQADIYSLGMVLYYLTNGNRPPFSPAPPEPTTPDSEKDALIARMEGRPVPPPSMCSPALANIIVMACAPEPGDRYADASEMRDSLRLLDENSLRSRAITNIHLMDDLNSSPTNPTIPVPAAMPVFDTGGMSEKPIPSSAGRSRLRLIVISVILCLCVIAGGAGLLRFSNHPADPTTTQSTTSPTSNPSHDRACLVIKNHIIGETFFLEKKNSHPALADLKDHIIFHDNGSYVYTGYYINLESGTVTELQQEGEYKLTAADTGEPGVLISLSPFSNSEELGLALGDAPVLREISVCVDENGKLILSGKGLADSHERDFYIPDEPYVGSGELKEKERALFGL